MKYFFGSLAVAFTVSFLSTNLFAHGGATGIVKERMDAMSDMSKAMKTLTPIIRGKTEYDSSLVSELALRIANQSGQHLLMMFPEGTEGDPSEAKPAIWAQWDRFETYANELEIIAKALSQSALKTSQLTLDNANSSGMGMGMMTDDGMGMMMDSQSIPSVEMLSEMPTVEIFRKLSQNCTACHTRFRSEKN
jgi:cytochrome c556